MQTELGRLLLRLLCTNGSVKERCSWTGYLVLGFGSTLNYVFAFSPPPPPPPIGSSMHLHGLPWIRIAYRSNATVPKTSNIIKILFQIYCKSIQNLSRKHKHGSIPSLMAWNDDFFISIDIYFKSVENLFKIYLKSMEKTRARLNTEPYGMKWRIFRTNW